MKFMKLLATLSLLLLVVGCATQAQQRMNSMRQAFEEGKAQNRLCRDSMKSNPSVAYTYENIAIEEGSSSSNKYKLLASNQKLTKDMKQHFLSFLDENSKCRGVAIEGISKVHPSLLVVVVNSQRRIDTLFAKLLGNEITIGEFNRQLQDARGVFDREFTSAARDIENGIASDHNSEMQSRQQAAAALQNWSAQQQQMYQNQMLYNNLNRPKTTNCNMYGNSVNCTSY